MSDFDGAAIAQMLTAIVAVFALFLSPYFALSISRRERVSEFRQQWLDGLRDDIAQLVAVHTKFLIHTAGKERNVLLHDSEKVSMLFSRIRLRLNISEPDHEDLFKKVAIFVTNLDGKDENVAPNAVYKAFDVIKDQTWREVKSWKV